MHLHNGALILLLVSAWVDALPIEREHHTGEELFTTIFHKAPIRNGRALSKLTARGRSKNLLDNIKDTGDQPAMIVEKRTSKKGLAPKRIDGPNTILLEKLTDYVWEVEAPMTKQAAKQRTKKKLLLGLGVVGLTALIGGGIAAAVTFQRQGWDGLSQGFRRLMGLETTPQIANTTTAPGPGNSTQDGPTRPANTSTTSQITSTPVELPKLPISVPSAIGSTIATNDTTTGEPVITDSKKETEYAVSGGDYMSTSTPEPPSSGTEGRDHVVEVQPAPSSHQLEDPAGEPHHMPLAASALDALNAYLVKTNTTRPEPLLLAEKMPSAEDLTPLSGRDPDSSTVASTVDNSTVTSPNNASSPLVPAHPAPPPSGNPIMTELAAMTQFDVDAPEDSKSSSSPSSLQPLASPPLADAQASSSTSTNGTTVGASARPHNNSTVSLSSPSSLNKTEALVALARAWRAKVPEEAQGGHSSLLSSEHTSQVGGGPFKGAGVGTPAPQVTPIRTDEDPLLGTS